MTSINPINVNTQGVNGGYGYGTKPKAEGEEATETPDVVTTGPQTPVAADDVLSYMAQTAVVVPTKTIDPSKYVDKESADRIAGFMSDFEDIVAKNLAEISAEFPGMSDSAKQTLALAQAEV